MAAPEWGGGETAKELHFRQTGEEGLSGWRDGACSPQEDTASHCYKQPNPQLLPLSPSDSPNLSLRTPTHPPP